jgi:hypothetical protein
VVKKGHAGFDGGLSPSVKIQLEADTGLFGDSLDSCLPWFHAGELSRSRG